MPKKAAKKQQKKRSGFTPKRIALILIAIVLFVLLAAAIWARIPAAISPPTDLGGFCGTSTYAACSADSDCMTGGCSNQVCQGKNEESKITICIYSQCFDAANFSVSCGCVAQKCAWKK